MVCVLNHFIRTQEERELRLALELSRQEAGMVHASDCFTN